MLEISSSVWKDTHSVAREGYFLSRGRGGNPLVLDELPDKSITGRHRPGGFPVGLMLKDIGTSKLEVAGRS